MPLEFDRVYWVRSGVSISPRPYSLCRLLEELGKWPSSLEGVGVTFLSPLDSIGGD